VGSLRQGLQSRPTGHHHKTLFEKEQKQKIAGDMAQVVEHLPSKRKLLSLNSSSAKKEKAK
jgi:hypothetical protein